MTIKSYNPPQNSSDKVQKRKSRAQKCRGRCPCKRKCQSRVQRTLGRSDNNYKLVNTYAQNTKQWSAAALTIASTSTASTSMADEPPEFLNYLGLMPKDGQPPQPAQEQRVEEDSEFRKPRIYYCDYCPKTFYVKHVHLKHTIRHMKRTYWCFKCKTPLACMQETFRHRCQLPLRKY